MIGCKHFWQKSDSKKTLRIELSTEKVSILSWFLKLVKQICAFSAIENKDLRGVLEYVSLNHITNFDTNWSEIKIYGERLESKQPPLDWKHYRN